VNEAARITTSLIRERRWMFRGNSGRSAVEKALIRQDTATGKKTVDA